MQNFPGWDTSFDNTNLHFHGMQVVPHLFFPQGTNNPSAQWISTIPGDAEQKCFCYAIQVPEDHPEGQVRAHMRGYITPIAIATNAWTDQYADRPHPHPDTHQSKVLVPHSPPRRSCHAGPVSYTHLTLPTILLV